MASFKIKNKFKIFQVENMTCPTLIGVNSRILSPGEQRLPRDEKYILSVLWGVKSNKINLFKEHFTLKVSVLVLQGLYTQGEIFSWNTNQVVNTSAFFNFKQHLLKAFFDKIKTDDRKWLFVAKNKWFKKKSKFVDMGNKKSV